MLYIKGEKEFKFKETAVALGNFDGIHKGHQLLIQEVLKAKKKGWQSVVFTFNPHPSFVLSHREPVDLILVEQERVKKFESLNIDILIEYPFTMETAKMSPSDFIEIILVKQMGVKCVVVGSDYRFGHKRAGDVQLLKHYGEIYNFDVIVLDKKAYEEKVISSSSIRELIKAGKLEEANYLLGAPFSIIGVVQHGKKLGRKFGIPTANIHPSKEKLLPPNGVYASQTKVNNTWYQSVTM